MIEKRNATHKIWGWKDPNAVNYLNQLVPKLINPHYVIVSRDAVATTKGHMRWHAPRGEVRHRRRCRPAAAQRHVQPLFRRAGFVRLLPRRFS